MIFCPRLIIAGLRSDAGKTIISVGLSRLWQKQGYKIIPFKKGPDYIDMGWLRQGAKHPCYNLDLFFMSKKQILFSFGLNTKQADIAIIEGNRGLYDGMDVKGSVSTAELAKLLKSPVILIVNCTKVSRTVAALVLGCQRLDQAVPIKAIILNNLAHSRHEGTIKKSIKRYCHLPVLGAMPRLKNLTFPGRHLGLVPPQEHLMAEKAIMAATKIVKKYLDTKKLWQIALEAPCLDVGLKKHPTSKKTKVNIGIIRDAAFQFYYPENIEALDRLGAKIVEFSALKDGLPAGLDGLYIGGGFPETQASTLAANEGLKLAIKNAAQRGLPIYAECGGLMYLSKNLIWQGKDYPLVGIFPLSIGVGKKPKGHGYTILKVECPNPFFKVGQILRGHEFHYSYILKSNDDKGVYFIFMVRRGYGMDGKHDGLCYRNVLATYTHLHALGEPNWARALIKQALVYKRLVS